LDVHPEPEHAHVEVQAGGETHDLGHLDAAVIIGDTLAGRAVIEALIHEGLYMREHRAIFEHVVHLSDVDTWLAYRAARASRTLLDPLMVEQARELLATKEGEIRVVERGSATLLRRSGSTHD
jgi:hypothetical protein